MRYRLAVILCLITLTLRAAEPGGFSIEDIIGDIYNTLSEDGEYDYEELQNELLSIAANPIDLNTATEDQLRQLHFLSDAQITDILLMVYKEPLHSVSELTLLPSLKEYELRDLLPFVTVKSSEKEETIYPREVMRNAGHELNIRLDARHIEANKPDPFYASLRYRFNYRNLYQAGLTYRRPVGSRTWKQMELGAYIELHDLWRFKTIVAGNYQAHFGQGLVLSGPFHMGKNTYVLNAATAAEGLRKYSGTDGASLHGIGATIRAHQYVDISAFYSLTAANDSTRKHTVGANMTVRYRRLRIGATVVENIYSDSLRYYYEHARYNQNYFRGDRQAVIGLNARWNYGIVDLFGEVAAAQNQRWGWAINAGARITPVSDIGLLLLYRYYSPTFDNTWGYSISETSRINDENGLYLGIDIRRLRYWRFSLYGDIFRFSGIKYGIPYAPSMGYDAMLNVEYAPSEQWLLNMRFRAREKARLSTFSTRLQLDYRNQDWHLRTRLDGNIVMDSTSALTYGVSIMQSVAYSVPTTPLTLQLQAQAFDARQWNNRIYMAENDVLYAYSNYATYGIGGRFYLNMRYRILPTLSLYLKFSETLYTHAWAEKQKIPWHRSDIHLLLRATL